MTPITLITPNQNTRRWHQAIAERLAETGFEVAMTPREVDQPGRVLDWILSLEAKLFLKSTHRLSAPIANPAMRPGNAPEGLVLDLTATAPAASNTFNLSFTPGNRLSQVATAIAMGALPDIALHHNGKTIATARPMLDDRVITVRGLEDVLARAVTLAVTTLEKHIRTQSLPIPDELPTLSRSDRFASAYITTALPRLLNEIWRRQNYHYAHWRVGYRFSPEASKTAPVDLSGTPWTSLKDDGTRFFADPFLFTYQSKNYIFVEDYPHKTGKALISVSEVSPDGAASNPQPIIEEDWHLSYPQVFEREGHIWMLPEASASNKLTLYRATRFPDQWEQHKVLIDNSQLSDATLLDHNGKLYLFATDRDGAGSTSDTLVIYHADTLEGPWELHPANPICIDRTRARPGGAFIKTGGKIFLPAQDGTVGYGGGLNLIEVKNLSPTQITLGSPAPINAQGIWPHPRIHTYNRAGNFEVIDGIAEVKKR